MVAKLRRRRPVNRVSPGKEVAAEMFVDFGHYPERRLACAKRFVDRNWDLSALANSAGLPASRALGFVASTWQLFHYSVPTDAGERLGLAGPRNATAMVETSQGDTIGMFASSPTPLLGNIPH